MTLRQKKLVGLALWKSVAAVVSFVVRVMVAEAVSVCVGFLNVLASPEA